MRVTAKSHVEKRLVPSETADAPVEADQNVLRDVVRCVVVVGEARRPRAHARTHSRDEPLRGARIARPGAVDEAREIPVIAAPFDHR